jgi:hypothetical protein
MHIKLAHASIVDEKISSFARAVMEMFIFFRLTDLWAFFSHLEKRQNFFISLRSYSFEG